MELMPADLLTTDQKIELINGFVPLLGKNLNLFTDREAVHWAAMNADSVAGLLSAYRLGDGVGEISVNFFSPARTSHIRLLDRWAWEELADYHTLVARTWRWNTPVKRILQRFGFRLAGTMGSIEVYAVKRPDILRLRRNEYGDD